MTGSDASGRALAAELVENRNPRSISGVRTGGGVRCTAAGDSEQPRRGPARGGACRVWGRAPRHRGPPAQLSLLLLSEETAG